MGILSLLILVLPACLHNSRARILKTKHSDLLCSNLDNLVPVQRQAEVRVQESPDNDDYRLRALSLEAKLSDIPIPLGSEPIRDFFAEAPVDDMNIVVGYTNMTDSSSLYNFFKTECIRLGWYLRGGFQRVESMLVFEKPDRICIISLRPCEASTALIISICSSSDELPLEVS